MIVKLRLVEQKDWKYILEIRNQDEVRLACYDTSIINYKTHEKYMKMLEEDPNSHQWIIVCDGVDVGQGKIDRGVLGYMITKDYRGKGIWSKAFPLVVKEAKKLGFKQLGGTVKYGMKKQLIIAEKLGFKKTEILYKDDQPYEYKMIKNLED